MHLSLMFHLVFNETFNQKKNVKKNKEKTYVLSKFSLDKIICLENYASK
jgi:hypothetical protein